MPEIVTRRVPRVTHIGHLDSPRAERRPSLDGPGIAVSSNPEDWRRMRGLNGPEYRFDFAPAEWLDVMAFSPQDIAELQRWGLRLEYVSECQIWHACYFDEETDEFVDFQTLDRGEAAAKMGRTLNEEVAGAACGDPYVAVSKGWALTKRAMARLGGIAHWPDALRWFDGLALLYAREVVLKKRPFVVAFGGRRSTTRKARRPPTEFCFPSGPSCSRSRMTKGMCARPRMSSRKSRSLEIPRRLR